MQRRIKIAHIVQSLDIGGLENGVVNLANNIDEVRFELLIICIKTEGELRKRLRASIKVICLKEKDGFNFLRCLRLARLFSIEKPDIVHMHGWGSDLVSGVIGARLAGVPRVINGEHGVLYFDRIRRIWAQKIIFLFVDYTLTVSYTLKEAFVTRLGFGAKKIVPIINGVDTNKFRPNLQIVVEKRKELHFLPDSIIIGTVGRLVPVKNYSMMLSAAQEVIRKKKNTKFIFIGDGPERSLLEQKSRQLGIENDVFFLGMRNDIADLLNVLDIFVLTSLSEGLSNTILEAMACAKPVIATAVGDNLHLVDEGKTGYLIPSGDTQRLVSHIIDLMNDSNKLFTMGIAGRKRAEEKFSLAKMIREYETLYKTSLSKN